MVALGQHTFNILCYSTYYTAASSNENESQQEVNLLSPFHMKL